MALIGVLQTLVDGQIITAAQHNSNYGDIKTAFNTSAVLTDVAKVITVSHVWAASQSFAGATMTGDLLFTDATFDIGKVGATRPRDLFLSRNLVAGGTFALGGNMVSDLLFTDGLYDIGKTGATRPRHGFFSGTLTAGGSFTSGGVGTFSGGTVFVTAALSASSAYIGYYTGGAARWAVGPNVDPPSNAFAFFNYGVGNSALVLDYATNRALFTAEVSVGGILRQTAAVSKLVPGATSWSLRNNADGADNLLVTDAGDVTIRGQAIFTSTTQPVRLQNNAQILWRNFANTADAFGIGTDITDNLRVGVSANFAAVWIGNAGKKLSFYGGGGVGGVVQPVIVGAKGGNAALTNLMVALAALNLVVDNTT